MSRLTSAQLWSERNNKLQPDCFDSDLRRCISFVQVVNAFCKILNSGTLILWWLSWINLQN